MEIVTDFKELLGLLNANNVDYMVVGGYAMAFHGSPRFTGDLDILVRPDRENAVKILKVLSEFGFGELEISEDDFTREENVIQLGFPPVRVDFITKLTGVDWEEAEGGRIKADYGGEKIYLIGKEQLIANKRALGRKRDLSDLEALDES